MTRSSLASLFPILLLLFSNHASAAIYKWKNEQGQINYGSMPPPAGTKFQKMGVSTEYTHVPPAKTNNKSSTKGSDKKAASGKDKEDPYTKEQHAKVCNNAKKDIASLNKAGRLRVKQKDGSTSVMGEKDKAKRMKTHSFFSLIDSRVLSIKS